MEVLPGTEVQARGLRWEVVATENLGAQTLYRLRGLEGLLRGRELDLLSPLERIEPITREIRPERAAPLRNWLVYHQAFLLEQALGPSALLAVQPGRLRIEPYQLVPVLRAIRMSRARLLLADGVGLGKTVEAGLILTELVARRVAHRVLIVSPAGPLLDQWKVEMAQRFGLRLAVVDREKLNDVRRGVELGANPFDHLPLALASIDYLKQERVLDLLERTTYDVIVIDEAHHCGDAGVAEEREDTQRRRLAQVLARRSDSLLLLTATPHDGNDRSFASLCELLDPSLVDGAGTLRGERYRRHVIRRLKQHVPGFRERHVLPIAVEPSPTRHERYTALHRGLLGLLAPELRRAFRSRRYADVLAYLALLKRSVSTVEACRATLCAVARRLQEIVTTASETQESRRQRLRTLRDYQRRLERFGTVSADEEADREKLEEEDLAQQLAALHREIRSGSRELSRVSNVVQALDDLTGLAEAALAEDPKLEGLVQEIRDIRRTEPDANILVYTEYVSSQRVVAEAIRRLGEVVTMNGDDPDDVRTRVTARFQHESPLALVSTDSAAEGLNLHDRCHHLIHLELPFNPNRLEQRNGRIDRYGQRLDPVVRYLYLRGTFEERILLRLIAKYERQRRRLTFMPNTLGLTTSTDTGMERLLKGMLDEDTRLFHDSPSFDSIEAAAESADDPATHELLEEIDRSLRGFEEAARTHAWLGEAGLNAEPVLSAEAENAHRAGARTAAVDLATFVCDAVTLDGGDARGTPADPIFELVLPSGWVHGLEELSGYDPGTRSMRATTRLEVVEDDAKRPVGWLGRAHPVVRRALDRVRNLSFGGQSGAGLDPRVSVVAADVARPALLHTFLCRVSSGAGRELERVVAILADAGGDLRPMIAAEDWLPLADAHRAVRTRDVWQQHFASWADGTAEGARAAAADQFAPVADRFAKDWKSQMEAERGQLDAWLSERAAQIIGDHGAAPDGPGLFDEQPDRHQEVPVWATESDPALRLAGFGADPAQAGVARSESDGVLRIYHQRLTALGRRERLGPPEIVPLGLLMLVPGSGDGT